MHYTRNWLKRNPENIPLLGRLIPEAAGPEINALYAFTQGIDAIARGSSSQETRRRELAMIEEKILTREVEALPEFVREFALLTEVQSPLKSYARDLLSAAVEDVVRLRYQDYTDLTDYFQRSAIPVLRALLYICGERDADSARADALAAALQLLGHIVEASDDYVNRDIVYLPMAWFALAGADLRELADSESTTSLRQVFDEGTQHCERLLKKAEPLTLKIHDRKLRMALMWVQMNALSLCAWLKERDPLAAEVRLPLSSALMNYIKAFLFA